MPASRWWNLLSWLLLGLAALIVLLSAWVFSQPQSRLDLLPQRPPALAGSAPGEVASAPNEATAAAPTALGYPTLPPAWTPTLTAVPTLTRTPRPTSTPTLTPVPSPTDTPSPTLTPTPTLPAQARVLGLAGHRQALSLSCESRSAADWAAFFGLAIDEMEFFGRLPVSDNPETGFVGDVNGDWGYLPPKAYGVHAGPVAELLRTYGAQAEAQRGLSWEEVQREIAAGRPVMVWVVGHLWAGTPVSYTAQDGQTTTVARYEHTMILVGYSPARVLVVDGEKTYAQTPATFLRSWSVLGNMAILWRP